MNNIDYIDWGYRKYGEALKMQQDIFEAKVAKKIAGESHIAQDFILCEHNNVYTLGKHGRDSNMLVDKDFLSKIGAEVYHINRGGDITYHGKGQITGYPSLDLDALGLGIRDYIYLIEQMVIDLMEDYGVDCQRLKGATGVWIDPCGRRTRKICAIGVKVSRGITMHGFALNVNTDLKYFSYINPCGFTDKGVTSIEKEIGKEADLDKVKKELYRHFIELI